MIEADRASPPPAAWLGLGLALLPALVRAVSVYTPLPHFDLDPLSFDVPSVGLTPARSILLSAMAIAGAALLMLARGSLRPWLWLLPLGGFVGAGLHGWSIQGGELRDLEPGLAWTSAIVAGAALAHASARFPPLRRAAAAAALAIVFVLALRGVAQVTLEHADTVDRFEQTRDVFFEAKGWAPDSPQARSYERRLRQAEATGWFGLANVYASFMAAGLVAGAGLLVGAVRSRGPIGRGRSAAVLGSGLVLLAGLVGLVLSGSKGGYAAAGGGLALLAAASLVVGRRALRAEPRAIRRLGLGLALAVIAAPLLAVVLRAAAGERLGELSLLFRGFYAQASLRMIAQHPVVGVGPEGFRDAYLLLKNPLSPEDIADPHSVLLAWMACLGVFGLLWSAWFVWMAACAGRALLAGPPDSAAGDAEAPPSRAGHAAEAGEVGSATDRAEPRAAALLAAAASLGGIYFERELLPPESALVRVAGMLAWCALAWILARALSRLEGRASAIALAAAGLALVAHAQIEVTATHTLSAGLFFALLGLAASAGLRPNAAAPDRARAVATPTLGWIRWIPPALLATLAVVVVLFAFRPAQAWESRLRSAADLLRPVGAARQAVALAESLPEGSPAASAELARSARQLGSLLTGLVQPTPAGVRAAGGAALGFVGPRAIGLLEQASALEPTDGRARMEASRLAVRLAERAQALDRPALRDSALTQALTLADPAGLARPPRAGEWIWLGLVYEAQSRLTGSDAPLADADRAYAEAQRLSPWSVTPVLRRFDLAQREDRQGDAAELGRRLLELHDWLRLDEAASGLTPAQLERARRAVAGPG